jgi:hypothetical protein
MSCCCVEQRRGCWLGFNGWWRVDEAGDEVRDTTQSKGLVFFLRCGDDNGESAKRPSATNKTQWDQNQEEKSRW